MLANNGLTEQQTGVHICGYEEYKFYETFRKDHQQKFKKPPYVNPPVRKEAAVS